MAKQAIDNKTRELPINHLWLALEDALNEIKELEDSFKYMYESWSSWNKKMVELKSMGINYAGTTYKDDKYLYLVYPSKNGEARRREYIGADPDKIAEAIGALNRGQEYSKAEKAVKVLEAKMQNTRYYIRQARQQ